MKGEICCPNCGCSWGTEEVSFGECDACDYPNFHDEEEPTEMDEEDFDFYNTNPQ